MSEEAGAARECRESGRGEEGIRAANEGNGLYPRADEGGELREKPDREVPTDVAVPRPFADPLHEVGGVEPRGRRRVCDAQREQDELPAHGGGHRAPAEPPERSVRCRKPPDERSH